MDRSVSDELIALGNEWDRSMVENDADAIGRYMADDWTQEGSLVGAVTSSGLRTGAALSVVSV
jgi:hypothetical protein